MVGAGPAGLSASYHLEDDYVLIEREDDIGGLCRSFALAGCIFDMGGHAFFTRHEHVANLLSRLGGSLYTQERQAWVYSHDTYVPYPFQSNIHGLPGDVVRECLAGAARSFATGPPRADTLDGWVDQAFGAGVAKHFLRPYNTKLWAHPLADIVPAWVSDRIASPTHAEMIDGAVRRRPYNDLPNACVSYPSEGGFVELFRGFLPSVLAHLRRGTVNLVDLDTHTVGVTEGDSYPFDHLVSTMPLTELVQVSRPVPARLRDLAAALAHTSLRLVNLVVDRPEISEMHRIYVADPTVPFHKLVLTSNSSPSLRASSHSGLQAEVSYSTHKPLPGGDLVAQVIDCVKRMGILLPTDRLVASSTVDVPYAYPVYTKGWEDVVSELRKFYADHDVYLLGRFGEWAYINSDEAVHRGRRLGLDLRRGRCGGGSHAD